jgi:hypothetical protein
MGISSRADTILLPRLRKAVNVSSYFMALHSTPASMLKESLDESIEAARICIYYKKTDDTWGDYNTGGCLGYPGAILIFSIIDTIGSYFRKNKSFQVKVDGKLVSIDGEGWEHFKILNSKYFKQNLSLSFIKALYTKFRSNLTHNHILGKDTLMFAKQISYPSPSFQSKAFATGIDPQKQPVYLVSLLEMLKICDVAVQLFKIDIDTVVPSSKQGKNFY